LWTPLFSITTASLAVEVPFLFHGTPSGHDVEFHLDTWLEVLAHWKQGVLYPHWAALAHFGYGEPRFIFYPPASWTLGAALAAIFPLRFANCIYIWLALAAAGVSMFLLAREWLDSRDATFAAVLYTVNPYHLAIVYWRSAFAELLASSLVPLLLLLLLRNDAKRARTGVLLAFLLAAAWLINAPAAVMIHYSLALMVVILALRQHSFRLGLVAAVAVALGAALAAFYLVPAIYEQRWINIAQSISPGARPLDNFLFVHTDDPDHDVFNRVISWIACAEILVTLLAAFFARTWRSRNRELWLLLVVWAEACSVMMISITNPLWDILPKLRFMQFPWRWLLCLSVPFAFLVTMGVRRWSARIGLYVAALCVLAFVWYHFQAPWWNTVADLRELQDNIATSAGYEGTDEYTPAGAAPAEVDKAARRATVQGPAHAAIQIVEWNAERKIIVADMSAPDALALKLFNYPAWRVKVNGAQVEPAVANATGQMLVPVQTGKNRVEITFIRTWDRTAGGWISVVSLLLAIGVLRKSPRSPGASVV
jgi:hypothetical protein